MKGANTAKRLNVPVFVGEFGTLNTAPEPSRTNWYRDVVQILNENNIPYTSFDYKGAGYSIIDENRAIKYPNLVNVLTSK
ncbi:Cellulase (glycosyl hydrolase family 5) [compost metagenome]